MKNNTVDIFFGRLKFYIIVMTILIAGLFPPQLSREVFTIDENTFTIVELLLCGFCLFFIGITVLSNRVNMLWFYWILLVGFTLIIILYHGIRGENIAAMLASWALFILPLSLILYTPTCEESLKIGYILLIVLVANLILAIFIVIGGERFLKLIGSTYHENREELHTFSIIGGQIILGYICALLIGLIAYLYRFAKKMWIMLLQFSLVLVAILWESRTGLMIALLTFIIPIIRRRFFLTFILICLIVISCSFLVVAKSSTRLVNWEFSDYSSLLRLNAILYSIDKIRERYLLGFGPSTLFKHGERNEQFDQLTVYDTPVLMRDGYVMPTEPHNSYLLILLDYGIVGLILFVLLISILFKKHKRTFFNNERDRSFFKIALGLTVVVGGLTSSFMMYNIRLSIIVWAGMSLLKINVSDAERSLRINAEKTTFSKEYCEFG